MSKRMPDNENQSVVLSVNGSERQIKADPGRTLLVALREELGLTGTKDGCSSGDCGACVVLMDGQPVNSCMVLAPQAQNTVIKTIEGLASEDGLHPLQRAFSETWAFQCGFCTPGMLMSCLALLMTNPDPSREEILAAVAGNFCRCTGYQGVVKAVQLAAAEIRSESSDQQQQSGVTL
jgi:carbon-monoxide dehydrogenase small subunit